MTQVYVYKINSISPHRHYNEMKFREDIQGLRALAVLSGKQNQAVSQISPSDYKSVKIKKAMPYSAHEINIEAKDIFL